MDLLSPNYLTVSNPLSNLILQSQCQSPVMLNHSEMSWNHLGVPFTHQLMPTHQQLLLQHLMPRGARQTERNTLGHSLSLPDIAGTVYCLYAEFLWFIGEFIDHCCQYCIPYTNKKKVKVNHKNNNIVYQLIIEHNEWLTD